MEGFFGSHSLNNSKATNLVEARAQLILSPEVRVHHRHPHSRLITATTSVRSGWNPESLFLFFQVEEMLSSAVCKIDGQAVWTDSAVEIFIQNPTVPREYFNFEFNSAGVCLAQQGTNRENRRDFSEEEYRKIERLPRILHREYPAPQFWSLTLKIPAELFGCPEGLEGIASLRCNVHKTGSKPPHWFSLYEIPTPRPDFHRPEHFGPLHLLSGH